MLQLYYKKLEQFDENHTERKKIIIMKKKTQAKPENFFSYKRYLMITF